MIKNQPSIFLIYSAPASANDFDDFRQHLTSDGTLVHAEERPPSGPQAGLEWLLPTAAFAYIAKSYFDGMLKEMGKEHYLLLKRGMKSLYGKVVGSNAPPMTRVSTTGKIATAEPKYSFLFSVMAEADDGLRFKLLIEETITEERYDAAIHAFIVFLDEFHQQNLRPEIINELNQIRVVGKTLLVTYSQELGRVVPVDPLEGGH